MHRPTFQPEARARRAPAPAARVLGPRDDPSWPEGDDPDKRRDRSERLSREDPGSATPCPSSISEASTTASFGDVLALRDDRLAKLEQVRKYAYSDLDLGVLQRFLELTFDRLRGPRRGYGVDACERRSPERVDCPVVAMKLVLRAMKLLHLCEYGHDDVCILLAHTSIYFKKTFALCGAHMDRHEVANALVLLLFIAHSYLLDETCPLSVWHQHLFSKYCSMRTLNAAVFRLLDIRGFRLKLDKKDAEKRWAFLKGEGAPPPTPQSEPLIPRPGPFRS